MWSNLCCVLFHGSTVSLLLFLSVSWQLVGVWLSWPMQVSSGFTTPSLPGLLWVRLSLLMGSGAKGVVVTLLHLSLPMPFLATNRELARPDSRLPNLPQPNLLSLFSPFSLS